MIFFSLGFKQIDKNCGKTALHLRKNLRVSSAIGEKSPCINYIFRNFKTDEMFRHKKSCAQDTTQKQ